MNKDYLDKWSERQIKNTEIIEKQQAKTKKMKRIKLIWLKFLNKRGFKRLTNAELKMMNVAVMITEEYILLYDLIINPNYICTYSMTVFIN